MNIDDCGEMGLADHPVAEMHAAMATANRMYREVIMGASR